MERLASILWPFQGLLGSVISDELGRRDLS